MENSNYKNENMQRKYLTVIVFIDYMDKFEQKEMKKIRPIKNTWYDQLYS